MKLKISFGEGGPKGFLVRHVEKIVFGFAILLLFVFLWLGFGVSTYQSTPTDLDARIMATYVGTYGPRTISLEGGALFYQRQDRPKLEMIPMSETLFRFEDVEYFRLEVVLDSAGRPTKLVGHYDNGHRDESPRSS